MQFYLPCFPGEVIFDSIVLIIGATRMLPDPIMATDNNKTKHQINNVCHNIFFPHQLFVKILIQSEIKMFLYNSS